MMHRLETGGFRRHNPEDYHLDISRSYRGDGIILDPKPTSVG